MAAVAVFTGCSKSDVGSGGVGDLQLSVSHNSTLVVKSSEDVDVNTFTISFTGITNSAYSFECSVGDFFEQYADGVMSLETGDYNVTVISPDTEDAEWEQPIFGCSQDFTISQSAVTFVSLVCTIQNMKVTVSVSNAFKAEFTDYNVIVTGDYSGEKKSLTWTAEDIEAGKAGYFAVAELTVSIRGTRTNGSSITETAFITDVAAADYHNITIDIAGTGEGDFSVDIDDSVNEKDDDFYIENDDTEESGTGPSIVWVGNPDFEPVYLAAEMSVNLTVTAPEGIATFVVDVESDTLTAILSGMGVSTPMDFINGGIMFNMMMVAVGLPYGDAINGQTYVDFPLSILVPMIYTMGPAAGSEHIFTLTVGDSLGQEVSKTLTFIMPEE